MSERTYLAIDLKSFYASVECVDLGENPLDANLVVADLSRTEKTICLAVSPALKKVGIPGRPRLFEVIQKVREVNAARLAKAPGNVFSASSTSASELESDPSLKLDYIVATPRMNRYMEVSSVIYGIYLKHIAPEHIHVYSIDEVFIDATSYLSLYHLSARDFATRLIHEVLRTTGITATAGIGTNLFLAKVAMDIVAKHIPPDKDGVRIAELDELSYREQLWTHRPLTDFWRVGHGYASKLEAHGMFTMGDVAQMSHVCEDLLYRLFGINAELLIDHAWGWEPCTLEAIKNYTPENNSLSSGQVLHEPYTYEKARLVVAEMADQLGYDLVEKHLVTDQVALFIGYDATSLANPKIRAQYTGPILRDSYGKEIPKGTHGGLALERLTSSSKLISQALLTVFDHLVHPQLLVRRINIVACRVLSETLIPTESRPVQLDFFTDYEAACQREKAQKKALEKEKKLQRAVLEIRKKAGKNALLKGINLLEGSTARDRNEQVGGHKA